MEKPNIYLSDIVADVASKTGLTKTDVDKALRGGFDFIGDCLADARKVYVTDFINFETTDYSARMGRNPRQPEQEIEIPAYRAIKAKVTQSLKRKIKDKFNC